MLTDLFPELLSSIMIWGVEAQEKDIEETLTEANHIYVKLPFPFQILMSHVNSTLRHVALSTPALWISICIINRPHPYLDSQPQCLLTSTQVYLERSSNNPLKMRIDLRCLEDEGDHGKMLLPERQIWNQILELVMGQSLRWQILSLGAECSWVEIVLESIANRKLYGNGSMPALTYMSLVLDYHEEHVGQLLSPPPPSYRVIMLNDAHKLTFLRLRGLALYVVDERFPPTLRVLHLDQTMRIPLTHAAINTITQHCPSLEHLSIHGDIQEEGIPLPSSNSNSILSFPELRSLRICGIGGLVYLVLLSAIDTPKLTSLVLKNIQECDLDTFYQHHPLNVPQVILPVNKIHSRKKPPQFSQMKSLSICNSDLSAMVYKRFFETLPTITNFTSSLSITTEMVSILYIDGSGDIPWPHLRSLTLAFDANMVEAKKATESILNGRRGFGYPLFHVRMSAADVEQESDEEGTDINKFSEDHNNAVIEEWIGGQDVWPPGRLYLDEHDVLF